MSFISTTGTGIACGGQKIRHQSLVGLQSGLKGRHDGNNVRQAHALAHELGMTNHVLIADQSVDWMPGQNVGRANIQVTSNDECCSAHDNILL